MMSFLAFTQDYISNIDVYTEESGLAYRQTFNAIEDPLGFIWILSKNGLQKFDGINFKSWTENESNGLFKNLTRVFIDPEGWLWIWNNDIKKFVFIHYLTEEILDFETKFPDGLAINKLDDDSLDLNNTVFKSSLIFYDKLNKSLVYCNHDGLFESINIRFIDQNHHVLKFEYNNTNYRLLVNHNPIKVKDITLFSCTLPEYYKGNSIKSSMIKYREEYRKAFSLSRDESVWLFIIDNKFFVFSSLGFSIYKDSFIPKNLISFISSEEMDRKLLLNAIQIYKDSKNNYWITDEYGLIKLSLTKNNFSNYSSMFNQNDLAKHNSARGILEFGDDLYINYEFDGLYKFSLKNPEDKTVILKGMGKDYYYGRPMAILDESNLLVGYNSLLIKVDLETTKANRIRHFENDLWEIKRINEEEIAICTDSLFIYNQSTDTYKGYLNVDQAYNTNNYYHCNVLKDNVLMLSGLHGVCFFDLKTKTFSPFYNSYKSNEFELPINKAYYSYQDSAGIFWIASSRGLLKWDPKTQTNKLYTTDDGMPANVCYAIFEDKNNNLWISTDEGIVKFQKSTENFIAFSKKDGLASKEFNKISHFQNDEGDIYFGGLNGVSKFNPNDINILTMDQEVRLSNIEALTKKGVKKDIFLDKDNSIIFTENYRNIKLQFSVPSLASREIKGLSWHLGDQSNWIKQTHLDIQLSGLDYGPQKIYVKGELMTGSSTINTLELNVFVEKPFYLKFWFLALVFGLIILTLYGYNRYRVYLFEVNRKKLQDQINDATRQIQSDKAVIEKQATDLKALDALKSKFFANVSHELRTPLTLIMGPIKALLKSDKLDARDRNLLSTAKNSGESLLKLVNLILDLSKIESSKMMLEEDAVDLYALTTHIISSFKSYAEIKDIVFIANLNIVQPFPVLLDKEKYRVILNNLLSNAMKFTPKQGEVTLTLDKKNENICVTVEDTGRGILQDDIPYVFDRFYQTKNTQTKAEGGTGIGLALSKEFVVLMKGELSVESIYGKGAKFMLSLPYLAPSIGADIKYKLNDYVNEGLKSNPNAKEDNKNITLKKGVAHILVVEDNDALRDYISMVLSDYYKISVAENGADALALLEKNDADFDLITSDVMMPVMDGFELIERLKSNQKYNHIPLVMLTARADFEDKLRALRIGVDDYLLKPFEEEELLARIENLLGHARTRLEAQLEDGTTVVIETEDNLWLKTFETYIEANLENDLLSIKLLLNQFNISESSLIRQVKRLTGLTPAKYVQEFRLINARKDLENRVCKSIADVAYKYCFKDPKYFSKVFKARFGKSPSAYLF